MTVGERIKKLRIEKKWTQKQLGEKCEIHEVQIRGYENGTRNPKKETLEKIADAFGVPLTQIMDFKQNLNIPDVDSAMYDFSNEETQLVIDMLSDFDKLNDKGKQKAVEYTNDLTQIDEYTKK